MAFLTNDKLTIVGAAGMIGSNMAQSALMMGLTTDHRRRCRYDWFKHGSERPDDGSDQEHLSV